MNLLDVLALVIIAFSALTALYKGLTVELFWLGGVVAGYILAVHFYQEIAYRLLEAGMGPALSGLIGFLAIFLLGVIAGSLAGNLLARVWKIVRLGWMDRLLGGVFGLLRGLLIVTVIFLAFTLFPLQGDEILSTSSLAPYFLTAAQAVVLVAPQDVEDLFESGYDRLYRFWAERELGASEEEG